MRELLFVFTLFVGPWIALIGLLSWGVIALDAASCRNRWDASGFQSRYGILSGCQINYQGRWIPEDRYRAVQD